MGESPLWEEIRKLVGKAGFGEELSGVTTEIMSIVNREIIKARLEELETLPKDHSDIAAYAKDRTRHFQEIL